MTEFFNENIPDSIKVLVGRCEIGETSFDNADMSLALKFGEMLWRRLCRMADYYDRQSGNYMPGDIRANSMADAAKDMRHVLHDTRKDL